MKINTEIIEAIKKMGEQGKPFRSIANELNLSPENLRKLCKSNDELKESIEFAEQARKHLNFLNESQKKHKAIEPQDYKKIRNLDSVLSEMQTDLDESTFKLMKQRDENSKIRKFSLLNEFVDFNCSLVLPLIVPMLISIEAIEFIIKNNGELKRKLTIIELIEVGEKIKIISLTKFKPANLAEFKKIAVKKK